MPSTRHPLDTCAATFEAVEERTEEGDIGCPICGHGEEYHRHESGLLDSFWWCQTKGCEEPRRDGYLTCATHATAREQVSE